MSFGDVYAALQQGVIDGAENNEQALIDQKHGGICKHYSYDGQQMWPDLIVISEKFFRKLSAKDQQLFKDAALEAQKTELEAWHSRIAEAKAEAGRMGVPSLKWIPIQ